jgi:C1A family cysteine protease
MMHNRGSDIPSWSTRVFVLVSVGLMLAATFTLGPTTGSADEQRIPAAVQARLQGLREEISKNNYKYTVGYNAAMKYSLDQLCGLVIPPDWQERARFGTLSTLQAPPSSFDWRGKGGVTPIKNQGGCGSCWAFGTVGPLECLIRIKCSLTKDLSEQYLVSCNEDGWGCGGGWWAHDYHEWKIPAGQAEAGAVLEAHFPYVASNAPCGGAYSHPWKIDDWAYISGYSVPSADAIKQAIMEYGPVAAAVYVGPAFQAYTGGIFDNDECPSCNVNHGIVLVGWDDNQGANGVWILRNSWGTGWGEDGYMRIEYGTSSVGYAANYIVFSQCPPSPEPSNKSMPWLKYLLLEDD